MEREKTQKLIEQIALLFQEQEKGIDDSSFLRQSIEKINARLDKLEAQTTSRDSVSQIPSLRPLHTSQEKFKSLEEIADQIINSMQNEKACPYEPTGKPCDHCSMCNSRGF